MQTSTRVIVLWLFVLVAVVSCSADAPATDSSVLIFERRNEPKENAFTFLVPKGWKVEGGMFHVDPTQAGGPGNSLEPKCDLTTKKDKAGTVFLRWLPSYNYADLSKSPQAPFTGGLFPTGSSYQGMEVKPLPGVQDFLLETFRKIHPNASGMKVKQRASLPELAAFYRKITQPINNSMAQIGLPPITYNAGGVVVDYAEGGMQYTETLLTALADSRGGAGSWSNQYTLVTRAPAKEYDKWKPAFDIMRQSIEFNPKWVARMSKAAAQRGQVVQDTMQHIQRIDQEIWENRQKVRSDIQHENYLVLTGQEEYVNPFTKKVERDTSAYEHRWTTSDGDRIYTDDPEFDPNRVDEFSNVEWKQTKVRKR